MSDSSLSSQLEQWVKSVGEVATLSIDEQTKINKAGADAGAKVLQEVTREQHYINRKTGKDPHLADLVLSEANNINGDKDGTAVFGFDIKKAYIARFINDGTKRISYTSGKKTRHDSKGRAYARGGRTAINGDHFVDNARKDANKAMEEAKEKEFKNIMKSKGVKF